MFARGGVDFGQRTGVENCTGWGIRMERIIKCEAGGRVKDGGWKELCRSSLGCMTSKLRHVLPVAFKRASRVQMSRATTIYLFKALHAKLTTVLAVRNGENNLEG
jgi:hypothetical protein